MADARWKQVERIVALFLGGERTNRDRGKRVEDVTHPLLSVEVKHLTHVPRWYKELLLQAITNAPPNKIPMVVVHQKGTAVGESLCLIRLADIQKLLQSQSPVSQVPPSQASPMEAGETSNEVSKTEPSPSLTSLLPSVASTSSRVGTKKGTGVTRKGS